MSPPLSHIGSLPSQSSQPTRLGAVPYEGGASIRVWAPFHDRLSILLPEKKKEIPLTKDDSGYFTLNSEEIRVGDLYTFLLPDGKTFPDPASRRQPQGVHGPSQVVDLDFPWEDQAWAGIPLENHIFYELHIGTFTPEGTFRSAAEKISYLKNLGITAIEIMPVASFPGGRNWGYDGVFPFGTQESYGGPEGLQYFVNEAHKAGLAVVLDVVYNHLGPEGNYLGRFGPYFTNFYQTGWGPAINFDDAGSDGVRRYFTENALMWLEDFHLDGLRLDAVHAIRDFSAVPFLLELGVQVKALSQRLGRSLYVFPESDLNDTRLLRPLTEGGFALDSQWSDDFHHSLHVLLTGERQGYYTDFSGLEDLARSINEGFVYSGQFSPHRNRRHGNKSRDLPPSKFISFLQNHDQVGNRGRGDRLSETLRADQLALGGAVSLLSPFLPLVFMGEEYGEKRPFPYFISHSDPALVKAVQEGRARDFKSFHWPGDPPDPQAEATYESAKLNWDAPKKEFHQGLLKLYKELIAFRRRNKAFSLLQRGDFSAQAFDDQGVLAQKVSSQGQTLMILFNFSRAPQTGGFGLSGDGWKVVMDPKSKSGLSVDDEVKGTWKAVIPEESFVILEKGETPS